MSPPGLEPPQPLEEVHPVLPNQNDTMHESAGKIGLYTRFFDYANFRFPLSTFLVDVLRHFCINISQLSVIGAAKNGWMSFSKRADNALHTGKHVTRDLDPVAADFNAQDYATLVAHPSPFQKFLEAFLCLVGLSHHYTLDEETYPRFLHKNGEEMDIFAFIHAPDPTKFFDEGGSGNQTEQGDSAGDGKGVDAGESSHPPKRLREDHETPSGTSIGGKSMSAVQRLLAGVVLNTEVRVAAIPTLLFVTASVSTTLEHEVGDHTDSVAGPNLRTIRAPQRFVISSDSSHHSGANVAEAEVDSVKPVKPSLFSADSSLAGGADPNTGVFSDLTGSDFLVGGIRTVIDPDTDLQKVYVPQWSVTNGSYLDDGRICREMIDEFAPPKFFASVRGMEHDQLFTEFNVGAARQMSLSAEVRMRAEYNVKERRRLKSVVEKQDELMKVRDGEIEDLKAQLLLKEIEAAEATRLRAQTSSLKAVEKSLRDEVNTLKERNTILEKERNALDVKVTDLKASVVGKERDLTDLNAQLTSVKSQNDNLVDRVHELEISSAGLREKVTVYDNCMEQLEKFQDDRMKVVNDKLAKLDADLAEMACHLEERFYPHLLNTISGRRWLLTHGLKLFLVKCLNSSEYLTALGAAISRAIEKGMQSGLAAGIDHGREGRSLADVAAYNPDAEAYFNSAL
ncbi:hypothetical protein Tco_0232539 [Tanacetum coccineum]